MLSLSRQQRSVLLGSFLGWSLDGYDLVLMLLVIPLISKLFFPTSNLTLSLLATFAAYVVTLVMRPVGGAIFGNFGDKIGRKKTMLITIIGFSAATFSTGLLPTWDMVGVLAPVLLVALRFTQGFFAGGEWGSGAVITMETAPKSSRGLLSGILQSGYNFGFMMASIVYFFVYAALPESQFIDIGWRIMFFTGIIPGLIALFVRYRMEESEAWLEKVRQKKIERTPLRKIFSDKENRRRFFLALVITTGLMYAYYTTMGFFPTFLQNYVNVDKSEVPILMIVATITSFFGQMFAGYLSQIIGRKKTLMVFAISAIIIAIPALYGLYHATSFYSRSLYTVILIFAATSGFGPIPAFLSERFSTEVRNSASGFVYNGGLLIGSWAPLIAVTILPHGENLVPVLLGINVIVGSAILLVGVKINPETKDAEIK
ncbi:MAG TPA: MFS transporter [Nitrosopumilaceae archaeon]|nr:MFS transporter [Nitrosopumilaceae archaeon]